MPADWNRINPLFEAAIKLSPSARDDYLKSACKGDEELLLAVRELVEAHQQAGGFLEDMSVTIDVSSVFAPGELVANRFRITRFVGRGGMGEVYEAYDEKLRLTIALKTIRPELAANPDMRERFRREVRVARQASHPGLCRVYDLVEQACPDSPTGAVITCLTMQFLEGESLQDYIKRAGPLSLDKALPLIRQIADAIDALHDAGIVHRDLKPGNIMLTRDDAGALRIVVTDFGLAKPLRHVDERWYVSRVDNAMGAPFFMAPEQLRDEKITPAADLYAFGLVIDQMITAAPAFQASSTQALLYQRLCEKPIPPKDRCAGLPDHWNAAILRCLEPDPGRRFARANEVVEALTPASPFSPVEPRSKDGLRRPLRLSVLMVLLASLLSLVLSLGAWVRRPLDTSLIIFPFVNLSGNKDLDYLCKGIVLELERRFTQLKGIRVMRFYEPAEKAPDKLNARFLLEAHLEQSGKRIRLTPRLTDTRDQRILWMDQFDRPAGQSFELQSEIGERVVSEIEKKVLLGASGEGITQYAGWLVPPLRRVMGFQLPATATRDSEAFDYYSRGRNLWDERTKDSTLAAIDFYNRALKADPSFALAYAALADANLTLTEHNYAARADLLARAREHAERAIRLQPDLAEAHVSLAAIQQRLWDWIGAEESYRRAIQAKPAFARAHRWYAGFVIQFGRFDEGLAETRRALDLDPYDYPSQSGAGLYFFYADRPQEAAKLLEETLLKKDLLYAHVVLGSAYARLGQLASGLVREQYLARAMRQADLVESKVAGNQSPGSPLPFADYMHGLIHALSGNRSAARSYLQRIAADKDSRWDLAILHCALNEPDKALDYLEAAAQDRDSGLMYIKVHPFLEPLRNSARFQKILQLMRL